MFKAASKAYRNSHELLAQQIGAYMGEWLYRDPMPIYRDIYGRRVLHMRERFPCFDVYDRLTENRYFHWYFIEHEGGLTLVYTIDDRSEATVTENFTRAHIGSNGVTNQIYRELVLSGFVRDESD